MGELARGFLEAAEIPAFLRDENTIGMLWTHSNVLGGVKLLVPHGRAAEARELLQSDDESGADDEAGEACPACGATQIVGERAERWWGALAMLTGFLVVPIFGARRRCTACDHRWEPREPTPQFPDVPAGPVDAVPDQPDPGFDITRIWWLLWALMLAVAVWMAREYVG